MKAILFYTTAVLLVLSLSIDFPFTLLGVALVLTAVCCRVLTLKDVVKYSGYKAWYKLINA